MPFSICSVPEVRQRTMHEFVQDLEEVEVIADDFLISGFGRSDHEVNNSLEKCRLSNLKLNRAKMKQHQSSVKFMGYLVIPQSLRPILQMLEPDYAIALKRFLGMVTYLAKIMPYLSEMTEPLRSLEDKRVEFKWLPQCSLVMNIIKKFQTEEPPHRTLSPRYLFKQTEKWKML